MRLVPSLLVLLAFVVSAFTLIGCSGDGGGFGGTEDNPFRGSFSGTFVVSNGSLGVADVTVNPDGSFTGSGRNTTFGANFTVAGQLTDQGGVSGTLTFENNAGTFSLAGDFNLSPDGNTVTGRVQQTRTDSGQTSHADYNLQRNGTED